jgi:hypothetical protein
MAETVNLPPRRGTFAHRGKPGQWSPFSDSLKALSVALKVDQEAFVAGSEPVRAIPDPWAQASTFAEAVLDTGHSMHPASLPQWRGLLALFALRRVRSEYSVTIERVGLDGSRVLDRVLTHLPPRRAVDGKPELWAQPYIAYIQPTGGAKRPIAVLNPASLLSAGRLSGAIRLETVPWMRSGLADPLAVEDGLPVAQLLVLHKYLEQLSFAMRALSKTHDGELLCQRIDDYRRECETRLPRGGLTAKAMPGSNPDLPVLYQPIEQAVEVEEPEDPAATSDCRVALRDLPLGKLKGMILVDESLAHAGKKPREVMVWGMRDLGELLTSPDALAKVRDDAAEQGYMVVTLDDLLTPTLVRLRQNARLGAHHPQLQNALLPITPLALLLEGNPARQVSASAEGTRVSVSMKLKLIGPGDVRREHTVTRNYRTGDAGQLVDARLLDEMDWGFGQAAVWPNFRTPAWTNYFARLNYPDNVQQAQPRLPLSGDILAKWISEASDLQHVRAAVDALRQRAAMPPWRDPAKRPELRTHKVAMDEAAEEVYSSSVGFEGIFYELVHEQHGTSLVGCAFLEFETVDPAAKEAEVAVDFGTTNTVACFNTQAREPISFRSRVVHPIQSTKAAARDRAFENVRWQFAEFLPIDERSTPTPSVVLNRRTAGTAPPYWIFNNVIYFQPKHSGAEDAGSTEIQKLQGIVKRSTFNLKWDKSKQIEARHFLQQLMTMVAAEATAAGDDPRSLRWRFSIPDAMARSNSHRDFAQALDHVVQADSSLGTIVRPLFSEGLAAARYMMAGDKGAGFTRGSINAVLDIGGGTTDVTLWVDDKDPVWKGSFMLAGQDFFTKNIVNNPELLRDIGLPEWAELLEPGAVGDHMMHHVGELLFSGPALRDALENRWIDCLASPAHRHLRATAIVFIAGIAHYLGLVVRGLIERELIKERDLEAPAFALCGRGAGLFVRMHASDRAQDETPVTQALSLFNLAANVNSRRPQLFTTKQPKLEVARGMFLLSEEGEQARALNPKADFLPSGLTIGFDQGEALSPLSDVGPPIAATGAHWPEQAEMAEFIERLRDQTGLALDVRASDVQGAWAEIRTEVAGEIKSRRQVDDTTTLVEPPFITALKSLVSELSKPAAKRANRISLEDSL